MKAVSALVGAALAFALSLSVLASCGDEPTAEACTGIPAGGCPLSHGVACEDPSCEAVYRCLDGNQWRLDHPCPPRDGGARDASAGEDARDAAPPSRDADIDAPPGAFGGPSCAALQTPDCALGSALLCSSACCGCEDLFVCGDGGWWAWGRCGDAGPVPE